MLKRIVFFVFLLYLFIFLLPLSFNSVQSNEAVIISQITDEHLEPGVSFLFERLKAVLEKIKALSPDLLISTGDHTTYNDAASYKQYNQAFSQVGGFVKFPSSLPSSGGVAFIPIAGNHDGWTSNPYDDYKSIRSFVIGDYRFVGFSDNVRYDFPYLEIEKELKKSCVDGKPIVVFHHYCPHDWISNPDLDISEEVWNRFDKLMQGYPVIAYLAGHNHNNRTEAFVPGYLAHTGGRTGIAALTAAGLSNGKINLFYNLSLYTPLIITEPSQYQPGLDYTKTKKGLIKVRAYIRANNSKINNVYYQLDQGNLISMRPAKETNYYEGGLNASALTGDHIITVIAKNSYGTWADGKQTIRVYFTNYDLHRSSPLCNNLSITPTQTATPTPILPSLTPSPTLKPTSTPTPTPISSNQAPIITAQSSYTGYVDRSFSVTVDGYDLNLGDSLTMKLYNPAPGLSLGYCSQSVVGGKKIIRCPYSGIPTTTGNFYGRIILNDGKIQVEKNVTTVIN